VFFIVLDLRLIKRLVCRDDKPFLFNGRQDLEDVWQDINKNITQPYGRLGFFI
jgi:hypothetical protein